MPGVRSTDLLSGAVAGATGSWLMGKTTSFLYAQENSAAREREESARGGGTAYARAAEKGARLAGVHLSPEEAEEAGRALHWMVGLTAGMGYGMLRRRLAFRSLGMGLAYGAAFFLVFDEIGNVALGLTPGLRAFPWQAHARGLAGHLVLGLGMELTLRTLDAVTT